MKDRICIIGLDQPQYDQFVSRVNMPVIAHEVLPKIVVKDGVLYVERRNGPGMLPVTKVIYHGIFADDLDTLAGLALWGGPCYPNATAMMNCRLKLPCLVRAQAFTQFGAPASGFASANTPVATHSDYVAKWGNWHCGENKALFSESWEGEEPAIIEPFIQGQSVRIAMIGEHFWQIRLEGEDWLKSIHSDDASFMEVDSELLEDTRNIARGFGLEMLGVDYIVSDSGTKHLLEVNHIPNVTRFPEMWEAFLEVAVAWALDPA